MVIAYFTNLWCLILPLIVALILSIIWTLTHKKHHSIRASIKSWFLVGSARTKTFFKEARNLEPKSPILNQPLTAASPQTASKISKVALSDSKGEIDEVIILPKATIPPVPKWPISSPETIAKKPDTDFPAPAKEVREEPLF
jgi:hypothetical protein